MPYTRKGLPFLVGKKQQDPMNPSVDLVTCGMGGFSSSLSGKGGAPEAKSASTVAIGRGQYTRILV